MSSYITARIPLQSPIGSEEPIGDSFPPGEAFWEKTQHFLNDSNIDSHPGGKFTYTLFTFSGKFPKINTLTTGRDKYGR